MASQHMFRRLAPLFVSSIRTGQQIASVVTKQHSVAKQIQRMPVQVATVRFMSGEAKFDLINIQDEDDFQKRVVENEKPVVVDFHATWCGPCKLLGPRLETIISEKNGEVVLAKVDIDDNAELAIKFAVSSVPTIVGIKNGKLQDKFIGLKEEDIIKCFVEKLVN